MVGFVAGLPFLYQLVDRERQLEVPKYVRPRTDTPPLTVGHGGCFGCIYSVRGAGGYQMFGITPLPIYDPDAGGPRLRGLRLLLPAGRHRQVRADRPRPLRRAARGGRGRQAQDQAEAGDLRVHRLRRRPRCLQRAAAGGAPWRLRSSSRACPPPSRTAGARATTTSACRRRERSTSSPCVAANLLVGNPAGAAGLECAYMGPELQFGEDAIVAGDRRRDRAAGERRGAREPWTSFAVDGGRRAVVRPRQGGRARVHRGGRRDRRARGAGQPLDVRARLAGRARGPAARGGRRAAGGQRRRRGRPAAPCPEDLRPTLAQGGRDPRRHGPVRPPAHGRGPAHVPRARPGR